MSQTFWECYGATRVSQSVPQPSLMGLPEDEDTPWTDTNVRYEVEDEAAWAAIDPQAPSEWSPLDWGGRPVRFIDGKDVGDTVTCLTAPGGSPVPVRLSEIGAVVIREEGGVLRREFAHVERVVSMTTDLFPWDEIEQLAILLQKHDFRLLSAARPEMRIDGKILPASLFDYEAMRKAAQNCSNTEMGRLEEAALALDNSLPTVLDGRLEPRDGGMGNWEAPAVGVIKSHEQNYLHHGGLRVLYQLLPGQRTPAILVDPAGRPKTVSWFVRLAQQPQIAPNWGLIRVEVPQKWFEKTFPGRSAAGWAFIDRLTMLLRAYRCRDETYGRAAVSLHPIVRAEQLLGALFTSHVTLARRFYRSQGL